MQVNFDSDITTYIFLTISIITCSSLLIGYKTFISGLILFFCLMTIRFKCLFMQDGADNVIYIVLPFVILLKSYNILSLNLINNFKKKSYKIISILAVIGILFQLSLTYFFGALSKLKETVWQNGEAIYYLSLIHI